MKKAVAAVANPSMSDHAECDAMREDHFGRFGLEPEFDLDAQALEQA